MKFTCDFNMLHGGLFSLACFLLLAAMVAPSPASELRRSLEYQGCEIDRTTVARPEGPTAPAVPSQYRERTEWPASARMFVLYDA